MTEGVALLRLFLGFAALAAIARGFAAQQDPTLLLEGPGRRRRRRADYVLGDSAQYALTWAEAIFHFGWMAVSFVGAAAFAYYGAHGLLGWFPTHWVDEDGDPILPMVCLILGLVFGAWYMSKIDEAARATAAKSA